VAVSNNGGFCVFACKQLHEIFGFPKKGKALLYNLQFNAGLKKI